MKKLLYLSLFVFQFSLCSAQSWQWGVQGNAGNSNCDDEGLSLARDNNGNLFMTGFFNLKVILGPDTLNAPSSIFYAYLVKYDSNGNVKWARQSYGGNSASTFQEAWGVVTDKAGNVYISGNFRDTAYFGSRTLIDHSLNPATFLVKYDAAGNVKWAKQSINRGLVDNELHGMSIDGMNNIYITGEKSDTTVFGNDTVFGREFFIVKYDSSGNVLWAVSPRSHAGSSSIAYSIVADWVGNTYITGEYTDSLIVGKDTIVSSGVGFIAKYNSTGQGVWVAGIGNRGYSVILDSAENVYSTGYYLGNTVIGRDTLLNGGIYDNLYFAKCDTSGNFIWARNAVFNSSNGCVGLALSADKYDNIYLMAGEFQFSSVDVYFGSVHLVLNTGFDDMALVKYDSSGNALCGSLIESGGDDQSGLIVEPSGDAAYFGGDLAGSVIFGPDTLDSPRGLGEYICLAKWKPCNDITSAQTITNIAPELVVYPNPSSGTFTFQFGASSKEQGISKIDVYNFLGEKVYSQLKIDKMQWTVNLTSQPEGIYFYRIVSESETLIGKGKIIIEK